MFGRLEIRQFGAGIRLTTEGLVERECSDRGAVHAVSTLAYADVTNLRADRTQDDLPLVPHLLVGGQGSAGRAGGRHSDDDPLLRGGGNSRGFGLRGCRKRQTQRDPDGRERSGQLHSTPGLID